MNALPRVRDFIFKCRHGFRGIPVQIGQETLRLDERLRRWDIHAEAALQQALRDHLRPGDVMFDIGANFGLHTLYAARLVGPAGRVIAFEPVPANVQLLTRNLTLSGLQEHVRIVNSALSDSPEPFLEMHLPDEEIAVTASLRKGDGGSRTERVANLRLDDFAAAEKCAPNLIKIDVEGAELEVLRGGVGLIERTRPALLIEVHAYALPQFGASAEELQDWLRRRGYSEQILEGEQFLTQEYFQALYTAV